MCGLAGQVSWEQRLDVAALQVALKQPDFLDTVRGLLVASSSAVFPQLAKEHSGTTRAAFGFALAANARAVVSGLLEIAQQRPRFPVIPVAYFRFTAPLDEGVYHCSIRTMYRILVSSLV